MNVPFLADYLMVRKSLKSQVLIAILCGAIIGLACGDVTILPPMIMFMITIGQSFSLAALDERNSWEAYRCTLPMSRSQLIAGRMVFVVVLALAFALLGVLIAVALSLAAPLAKNVLFLSAGDIALSVPELALSCVVAFAALLIILGICFPVIAKCGMTRSVRTLPLIFALVFLAIIVFAGGSDGAGLAGMSAFVSQLPLAALGAAALAIGAAAYVGGGFAAMRLYEAREF